MKKCGKCGAEWQGEGKLGFRELCDKCGAFLHACINCRLYDKTAHNQCKSPTTEWVEDRERGNYCEEFRFADSASAGTQAQPSTGKDKWKSLFKG